MNKTKVELLKEKLCNYSRLAYQRGLVSGAGGNISIRIGDSENFLITPSGVSLRCIVPDDLVIIDRKGNKISGSTKHKPSKETAMHLAIYNYCLQVNAVIHLHPPYCIGFSMNGKPLSLVTVTAEKNLHGISVVPKSYPGSEELTKYVTKKAREMELNANLILLIGHGIITFGKTIEEAFNTADLAEETAKISFINKVMNR